MDSSASFSSNMNSISSKKTTIVDGQTTNAMPVGVNNNNNNTTNTTDESSHNNVTADILLDSTSEPACHWSTCNQKFSSKDDLIPHVSKLHLSGNHNKRIQTETSFIPGVLSCQWAFCTLSSHFTSPDTLLMHIYSDHINKRRVSNDPNNIHGDNNNETFHHNDDIDNDKSVGTSSSGLTADGKPIDHSLPHACNWVMDGVTCSHRFPTFDSLTEHLSGHVGSGHSTYSCHWGNCDRDKPFPQRQKIMRHLQRHTGYKPYQCTICGEKFSEAASNASHMRLHNNIRPFICDQKNCEKKFAVSSALTIHKRTHTGERPFLCGDCGKRFSESSNLTKHRRIHSDERPFKCEIPSCLKTFKRVDQVRRHSKVHLKKSS